MIRFELTEEQEKRYEEWAETHECKYRTRGNFRYVGAIGGADTFEFTGTGLGIIQKVRCLCGAELDLTDYDMW